MAPPPSTQDPGPGGQSLEVRVCCWGRPDSRWGDREGLCANRQDPGGRGRDLLFYAPRTGRLVRPFTYLVWSASFLALALRPRRWSDAGGRLTPGDAPTLRRTFQVIFHWTRGPLAFAMVGPGPPPDSQLSARCKGGGHRRRQGEALQQPRGFRGTDLSVVLSSLACFSFRCQFCGSNSCLKGV